MSRSRAALLVLVASAAAAPAQPPDPEAATPGVWRVVVQTAHHPLLTPAFRDRLRRDLLAALPVAAAPVATVEVVDLADVPRDRWDPLWQQVEAKGLAALDGPHDLTGVTTSFLRVDYRDGAYHLEARLYDGFAGLAAPPTRRQVVRAPELVGRAAGLLVGRDFGPDGTVEPVDGSPDAARIRFRAGTAGPLDRLVKVGDVFAVSKVTRTSRPAPRPVYSKTGRLVAPAPGSEPPAALSAAPREDTYLRVTAAPKDGVAECAVFSKYQQPFPKDAAAYRCLKLAVVRSPVAIRLVNPSADPGKDPPTRAAQVRANDRGFLPGQPDRREFFDFADGVYRSGGPLNGLACVTITLGATRQSRFPVPVLGPDPVGLPFAVDAKAEEKAAYERAVLAVSARAADVRTAQAAGFDDISRLIKARNNPEALSRAKAAFATAEAHAGAISDEVRSLRGRAEKPAGADDLLNAVDRQVVAVRESNKQLGQRIRDLEGVIAKENNPANAARAVQAEAVNVRIGTLLAGGEVDEALAAYDQLITLLPEDATVKERRAKLAEEWKPKSEEHAKQREYLLKTWPAAATAADLKDALPRVRTAVDALKSNGDRHALRRFARLLAGVPARVEMLAAGLEGNPAALAELNETAGVYSRLDQEVTEFLGKGG